MLKEDRALFIEIRDNLRRQRTSTQQDINLGGGNFAPGKRFQLYVGVTGTVVGIAQDGSAINRTFVAGYHPIWMTQVTASGTAATSLAALFEY